MKYKINESNLFSEVDFSQQKLCVVFFIKLKIMSASVAAFAEKDDRNSKLDEILKHGSSKNKNNKKPVHHVVDGMKFVGKIKLIAPQENDDDEASPNKER